MSCPRCQVAVAADASFCQSCGAALRGDATSAKALPGGPLGGKDEPEEILWQGTFSKLAMIGSWIAAATVTLITIGAGLAGLIAGEGWLVALGALALFWLALLARLLYLQLGTHYYLTSQRLIHEKGLLWRDIDRIETIDIDDVACHQGPIERVLGTGTIRLTSSDRTTPEIVLPGIEQARQVAAQIDEARRKERRKRGMYVESV